MRRTRLLTKARARQVPVRDLPGYAAGYFEGAAQGRHEGVGAGYTRGRRDGYTDGWAAAMTQVSHDAVPEDDTGFYDPPFFMEGTQP